MRLSKTKLISVCIIGLFIGTSVIPSVQSNSLPDVYTMSSVINITTSSAQIWGWIPDDGGSQILERRFDWGVSIPLTEVIWDYSITVLGPFFWADLSDLSPDTTYYFRAWARNSDGWSYGNIESFTTEQTTQQPPPMPTNPYPGSTSSPGPTLASNTVTMQWDPSPGATRYALGVRNLVTNQLEVDTWVYSTSYTVTLQSNVPYRWNVAAWNDAGYSSFTTPLYFQTPDDISPPPMPTNPYPGSTSSPGPTLASNTVTMQWDSSPGATRYALGVRNLVTDQLEVDTWVYSTSYTVTLQSNVPYRWNVAAWNDAGYSSFTTPLYFHTPDDYPGGPGEAWSMTEVVSTESTWDSRRPSLFVDSIGTVHVAWSDIGDYVGSSRVLYKSKPAGGSWGMTEVVSTESTSGSKSPSLFVDSDGMVHVAWEDETNYDGCGWDADIFYKSKPAGGSWSITEVVSTESTDSSGFPSLAVDNNGTVHVAWHDYTDYAGSGSGWDIFYKSKPAGGSWTTTEVVSTESTYLSWCASLFVDNDGMVHVAWEDETNYDGCGWDNDIFYKSKPSGGSWSTTEVVSTESTWDSWHPALFVDNDGMVHVTWQDWTDFGGSGSDWDIFYKSKPSGGSWTTTEVVSTESTSGSSQPSLAVDFGEVHVAWVDRTDYGGSGSDLDIFYKSKAPGEDWSVTEVVSTESTDSSYHCSLAVDFGEVHVAWVDRTDYGGSGSDLDIFYKYKIYEEESPYFYVVPLEVTDIDATSATLNAIYYGTVPGKPYFYYGLTDNINDATEVFCGIIVHEGEIFSQVITNLNPETTYHWWVYALQWDEPMIMGFTDIEYGGTFTTLATSDPDDCGKPVLISPLEISPGSPYFVGDTLTATFTIRNDGDAAITLDKLLLGGRYNDGELPGGDYPDFTYQTVTLQPEQSYEYQGTFTIPEPGEYNFFIAYYIDNPTEAEKDLLDENNWNTCVELGEGLEDEDRTKQIEASFEPINPRFLILPFSDPDIKIQQGWRYTAPIGPDPDDPYAHNGIDYIRGVLNQPVTWQVFDVVAAADGVAMHSSGGGYGDFVLIRHNEIDTVDRNYFTLYGHMGDIEDTIIYRENRFATDYENWTPVNRGQKIGVSGDTGSPGLIHLHFEVQRGGYAQNKIDPYDIYKTRDYYPGGMGYAGCGVNSLWVESVCPSPDPFKFTIGDWVQTTANLNVREDPGFGYTIIDTMPLGISGQILSGPVVGDSFFWWEVEYAVGVKGWSAENWLELHVSEVPICSVKLQMNGVEIDEVGVWEFFDIYVEDSVSDIGIKQVRFSSDHVRDGYPTGEWTDWFEWDVSSEDWDAATKIKHWAFDTSGYKEVWAQVKDEAGYTAFGFASIFVPAPALPVLASPLIITPEKDVYNVGDSLEAEFTIVNIGDVPINLDVLTVGGRLNGFIPPEGAPDFTFQSVTLLPNEPYLYQGTLQLDQNGQYCFFIAYHIENPTSEEERLLDENHWNTCVELGEGLTHNERMKKIIVFEEDVVPEEVSQLKDTIDKWKHYHIQFQYPSYLLGADSFTSAVSTLWTSFTSFITRTDLTEKYDELYFTGVEYQWLSSQAVIDAGRCLDDGDVEGARRYLERSYTFNRLSCMSFEGAAELYDGALETGEILAKGIKDGCQAAVKFGVSIVYPPAAPKVDAIYMSIDFVITSKIEGVDQAVKDAATSIITKVLLKNIEFTNLNHNTLETYVNTVGSKVSLDALLANEQFMTEFGNELRNVITDRVKGKIIEEISEAIVDEIVEDVVDNLESLINSVNVKKNSPVELKVLDLKGQITGLTNKTVKHEIPMSLYYNGTVTVYFPTDNHLYEVTGTDIGVYGLEITYLMGRNTTIFNATFIPTSPNTIHRYIINWSALSQGDEGVTIHIDTDGDGVVEKTITSGDVLTYDDYILKIDDTPPVTTKTVGYPKYGQNNQYVTSNTEFNLTATDDLSGVDTTFYRTWYNGEWNPVPGTGVGINNNFSEYTSNFTLSGEGKHHIEYYSVDNAGNVENSYNQTHFVVRKFDVNNDGRINFQDALLVWAHRTEKIDCYIPWFDVNNDGVVDREDAELVWNNRDGGDI
jgi:murein DD-endopeptidase MepM/ murein hydrolase activator NlpD